MRVVVRMHEKVKRVFDEWRRSLSADAAERSRLARELWTEFETSIVSAAGLPEGAVEDTSTRPVTYWCGFPGGGLAQIVIRPARRVSLFATEREVVVVGLVFSPAPLG